MLVIVTLQNYGTHNEYSLLPMGLNGERRFNPLGMNECNRTMQFFV
jgi:hypothetical protein